MPKKHIKRPTHVRQVLSEQINVLRQKEEVSEDDVKKARAIGYLSSVALTAIRDGELEERLEAIEEELKERRSKE